MDFWSLGRGEKFIITRRRSGMDQEEYARSLGLTRNQYGRLERDSENAPSDIIEPNPKNITILERCFLKRRTSGKSQAQCAAEMGITRVWYNKMENNQVPNQYLIDFWG